MGGNTLHMSKNDRSDGCDSVKKCRHACNCNVRAREVNRPIIRKNESKRQRATGRKMESISHLMSLYKNHPETQCEHRYVALSHVQ